MREKIFHLERFFFMNKLVQGYRRKYAYNLECINPV